MTAGAVSSAIMGGDIGMGALGGAIGGAIAYGMGFGVNSDGQSTFGENGFSIVSDFIENTVSDQYMQQLIATAGAGALGGGVAAELSGGSFGEGAAWGAGSAAAGHVGRIAIQDFIDDIKYSSLDFYKVDESGNIEKYNGRDIKRALTRMSNKSNMISDIIDVLVWEGGYGFYRMPETYLNGMYIPSSRSVLWNPKNDCMYDGTEAWQWVDPEIILGHELIHAFHDLCGEIPSVTPKGFKSIVQYEEMRTVGLGQFSNDYYTENQMRNDYGEFRRPRYTKSGW